MAQTMANFRMDENDLVQEEETGERKLNAFGSLNMYADPSKIATEKEAWPKAAVTKHDNS